MKTKQFLSYSEVYKAEVEELEAKVKEYNGYCFKQLANPTPSRKPLDFKQFIRIKPLDITRHL